jgi:hypothetical protein
MRHAFVSKIAFRPLLALAIPALTACLLTASSHAAETGTISGSVKHGNGKPVPGAMVFIVGMRMGTMTDSEGRFTIGNVPEGTFKLKTVALGANSGEQAGIQVAPGQVTTVDFVLQRSVEADETSPVYTGIYDPCDDLMEGDLEFESLVQIGVEFERSAGTGEYRYNVKNRSGDTLTEIRIGYGRGVCELTGAPSHVVPDTALGPPGWVCTPVLTEDSTTFALSWKARNGSGIGPHSSLSGFRVILQK